jgi:acetyltransferase-like isoleucine patch superfamily enzyme
MFIVGDRVWLGQTLLIDCSNYIEIGDGASVVYNCKVCDSNHHFIVDSKGNIPRHEGKIIIGAYNWIGNNTTITKGCVTTKGTICSHGSLLNKDYAKLYESEEPMFLVGSPAKLVKKGNLRIFSGDIENKINQYFKENPDANTYHIDLPLSNNDCELRYYL